VFVLRVCACAVFVFVMRVAVNELGPEGGKCVAASLSVLTGLQTLELSCTVLFLLLLWGWVGIVGERGSVWVFVFRVCACAVFVFVMRVADNNIGPEGGKCVAASLSVLTGLQTLNLGGTSLCLLLEWGWFWDCVRE